MYIDARTPAEVCRSLHRLGPRARLLAGGTTLYELAHRGLLDEVETLIDLHHLGLDYVRADRQGLRIGAMTTFTALGADPLLRTTPGLEGLVEAIYEVRPVQVRNVGTVGGAVCSGLPFFDLPPMLLALDAHLRIFGPRGQRELPLDRFYVNYFTTRLRRGEFLSAVRLPRLPPGSVTAFQKFAITGDDWALINCGVRLTLDPHRVCQDVRIAVGGGVTPTIHRPRRTEALLHQKALSEELLAEAARTLGAEVDTVTDARASAEYRLTVAGVILRRALRRAMSRRVPA